MFENKDFSQLVVSDLRLWVHLGCFPEERRYPQLVSVDLTFSFHRPPLAMQSDELKDTICYLKVVETLQTLVVGKDFALIEHLVHEMHGAICNSLTESQGPQLSMLSVRLKKVAPPVPGVHGGVSFEYAASPLIGVGA